jgi:hypothetical protein
MALTDIDGYVGEAAVFEFNRGNGGTVTESVATQLNEFKIPAVVGGAGEVSYVF